MNRRIAVIIWLAAACLVPLGISGCKQSPAGQTAGAAQAEAPDPTVVVQRTAQQDAADLVYKGDQALRGGQDSFALAYYKQANSKYDSAEIKKKIAKIEASWEPSDTYGKTYTPASPSTGEETVQAQNDRLSAMAAAQRAAAERERQNDLARRPAATDDRTDQQESTVYVTNTGEKYHRSGCQYLRKSRIAMKRSDAIAQGYTACSRCGGG